MATRVQFTTKSAGTLNCDVVGTLDGASTVVVTVHDLGCNSTSWTHFVQHSSTAEITKRVAWLHINLPGQEENAENLPQG